MNINNVYECDICRCVSCNTVMLQTLNVQFHYVFHKKTLVYRKNTGVNVDLKTGEMYPIGPTLGFEYFIDNSKPMVPVSSIIEFEKDNMTKGKILDKYNNYKQILNRSYVVDIKIVTKSDYFNNSYESTFVKKAIVYKGDDNYFYDLSTKEKYKVGCTLLSRGEMFVNPESMMTLSEYVKSKKESEKVLYKGR